jgi:hypothetical protein
MFMTQQISPDHFFSTDGEPWYRPSQGLNCMDQDRNRACVGQHGNHVYKHIQHNTAALFWTNPANTQASFSQQRKFVWLDHQMKPLTRSAYGRARAMFPVAFDKLTRSHVRSISDFSPTILIPNLEMALGFAMLDTNKATKSKSLFIELKVLPIMQRNLLVLSGRLGRGSLLCVNNGSLNWHNTWLSKNFHVPADWLNQSSGCTRSPRSV